MIMIGVKINYLWKNLRNYFSKNYLKCFLENDIPKNKYNIFLKYKIYNWRLELNNSYKETRIE